MSKPTIQPRTLKGFRDILPNVMMAREQLMETARGVYRSYGFSPIDTPALEYTEILLGKGSDESDKQLFRFQDQGNRDVALRFDLTVPFARFAAQHFNDIGVPFKRYHIGTVWRGEKPQQGRYREFMQCDFDTIGTESNAADIETLMVIHDLLNAIGFEKFGIHVNNRLILNGMLEQLIPIFCEIIFFAFERFLRINIAIWINNNGFLNNVFPSASLKRSIFKRELSRSTTKYIIKFVYNIS